MDTKVDQVLLFKHTSLERRLDTVVPCLIVYAYIWWSNLDRWIFLLLTNWEELKTLMHSNIFSKRLCF